MIRELSPFLIFLLAPLCGYGTVAVVYRDGTRLTIDTASTGPNVQASYSGGVESEGEIWHRVVADKQGKVIFTYDLDAGPTGRPGTFRIQIKPVDPSYAEKIRAGEWQCCGAAKGSKPAPQSGPVPTVASVRDFPEVKVGESVVIDILYNPATGDKIYDVLALSVSTVSGVLVSPKETKEKFSLDGIRVAVNGRTVREPDGSGLVGAGAMIYVPGKGGYFLALRPPAGWPFQPIGRAEQGRLTFTVDQDTVEITSKTNVLKNSGGASVWVYHDSKYKPDPRMFVTSENSQRERGFRIGDVRQPTLVAVADDVEALLPAKH